MCAALQDALHSSGVMIDDSHNTGDSIFLSLQRASKGDFAAMVRVEHQRAAR
jgi:hypothetical protein